MLISVVTLRFGVGGGKWQAERRNGMSEAARRSDDASTRRKHKATALSIIRPRRARVTGLWNVRWSRMLNPRFLLFRIGGFFMVALRCRNWRHLRRYAKDFWGHRCAGCVGGIGRLVNALAILLGRLRLVQSAASWDDAVSLSLTIPASRGNNGRWSGVKLQCRRCHAIWRVSFDTTLFCHAVQ